MENELVKIFERANKRFLYKNTAFILSNVAERSLCSTLAQCLYLEIRHSKYSRYYVDVEYNRNNGRVKTICNDDLKVVTIICDLIVHSRGEIVEKDNLIALEMKKSYRPKFYSADIFFLVFSISAIQPIFLFFLKCWIFTHYCILQDIWD